MVSRFKSCCLVQVKSLMLEGLFTAVVVSVTTADQDQTAQKCSVRYFTHTVYIAHTLETKEPIELN